MSGGFEPSAVRERLQAVFAEHGSAGRACGMLKSAGHQSWLVGGAVRDALLGRTVEDIDIATDAGPRQVQTLAGRLGFRTLLEGCSFGTVRIVIDGRAIEVTSFRRDFGGDGRRPEVEYTDSLEEDALRRDFTINALYADEDGNLRDPLGAADDLKTRRVRFVGSPDARIQEDFLRILRFFRFHAHFADPAQGMDAPAMEAVRKHANGLRKVSKERAGAEFMKLLTAPSPACALRQMQVSGVLRRVLPGARAEAVDRLERLERRIGLRPDAELRLAAIGSVDPKASLRIGRVSANRVAMLRAQAMRDISAAELGYRLGEKDAFDICMLRAALTGLPAAAGLRGTILQAARQRFPVSADDLMGSLHGRELGDRLRLLEQRWIDSGFVLTKAMLLALPGGVKTTP